MPLKKALAIALAAILTPLAASEAFAAPTSAAPTASHARKTHEVRPTSKVRPASPKVAATKRKHDQPAKPDTKPDGHGTQVAIAMAKPMPMPMNDAMKPDPKKIDPKKAPMKEGPIAGKSSHGKKREARKSEAKKGDAKKANDKGAVPVVAAAITEPLPSLPEPKREPLAIGKKTPKGGKAPCLRAPIDLARGTEQDRFSLTKCDGTPAPLAIERVSILLRPGGVARPTADVAELAKTAKDHAQVAPGIARIDARLIERLGVVTEHFGKADAAMTIHVVSGYRPASAGSYHQTGRAIDFKIEGTKNEDVVAFCKTLDDTGCGYYPNSSFVHMDVREPGTGHVAWIDASGPGEAPSYVASWPPPAASAPEGDLHAKKDSRAMIEDLLATLEKELPKVPVDDHPAEAKDVPAPKAELEKDIAEP